MNLHPSFRFPSGSAGRLITRTVLFGSNQNGEPTKRTGNEADTTSASSAAMVAEGAC
jgi:hypothetical protein